MQIFEILGFGIGALTCIVSFNHFVSCIASYATLGFEEAER